MHRQADAGSRGFVITAISDLTEIVAAQEAIAKTNQQLEQRLAELHASEHRYQSLIEAMNDGLIETDEIPALTYVNPGLPKCSAILPTTCWAGPRSSSWPTAHVNECRSELPTRKAGHSEVYELSWLHRDGHEVHTRISSRPHFGPDGRYTGSTANVTDMTEQKRVEIIRMKAAQARTAGRMALRAQPDRGEPRSAGHDQRRTARSPMSTRRRRPSTGVAARASDRQRFLGLLHRT